ncbi:MAG: hypothetical protein ABII23_02135 [bacterium]
MNAAMDERIQWDDDFLNNLKKGFESLSKNEFACVIMEADSSLVWILARNNISEPYHLVWKLNYATWKNLLHITLRYNSNNRFVAGHEWVCAYSPVGNVMLKFNNKEWICKGTFPYFVQALKQADKNILRFPTIV